MPVSITEIVFHGSVNRREEHAADGERSPSDRQAEREQLIEDTVAEVLRILRRQQER
jgi:hypothetical protein